MGLESKQNDSPFQGQAASLSWVPAVSNLVLAAGSILFLAYVAMQMRNLSVAVNDKTASTKQIARIKALEKQLSSMEKQVGQGAGQSKDLDELKNLVAAYFDLKKAKDQALDKVDAVEESVERNLATLNKGVKGRKKKQVEVEIKRVQAEGQRQLASVKEKSQKASADLKKVIETLKEKVRRDPAVLAPKAKKKG